MKICITQNSIRDFNSFFKKKAKEHYASNKGSLEDLYRSLYNEALAISDDIESTDNRDIVIQHLVLAPLALKDTIPELKKEIDKAALDTIGAISKPGVLEKLIKDMREIIKVSPENISDEEVKDTEITNDTAVFDDPAVHMSYLTTLGTETLDAETNEINPDTILPFAALRTVITAVKEGSRDYKIMAMRYDRLNENIKAPLDISITNIPKLNQQKNTVVFVIANNEGVALQFNEKGEVVEDGKVPVFSPISPSQLNDQYYQWQKGESITSNFLTTKFEAWEKALDDLEKGKGKDELTKYLLGTEETNYKDGLTERNKKLFKNIRDSKYTLLDIDPTTSTFGYHIWSTEPVELSIITGISNFNIERPATDESNSYFAVTGSTLHGASATVVPKEISTNPKLVETIIELLTNPKLTINNVEVTPKQVREILSNFIAVNQKNTLLQYTDSKVLKINGKQVKKNKGEVIKNYFNTFLQVKEVSKNEYGQQITTDLNDPNNTSNMLYQDKENKLYKIYKPKYSYKNNTYQKVEIKDGAIILTDIKKEDHVIATGSINSKLNSNNELRVYHAKIAYADEQTGLPEESEEQGLNKSKQQKERNEAITKADEEGGLSWFKKHDLNKKLELKDRRFEDNAENRSSVAKFVGDAIILFKGSDFTDIYHEAWHGFTQGILTPSQRAKLYASAIEVSGVKVKDVNNLTRSEQLEIEEYLAEEFRTYAIGQSRLKKTTALGKFFEKILNAIKLLIGKNTKDSLSSPATKIKIIKKHFKNLYTNNINVDSYDLSQATFKTLNKTLSFPHSPPGVLSKLSAQDTFTLKNIMDVLMSDNLDAINLNKVSNGFESIQELKQSYQSAYDSLVNLLDENIKKQKKTKPDSLELKKLQLNEQMLDAAIQNFGDLNNINNNIPLDHKPTNVIGFHLINSDIHNYNTIRDIAEQKETEDDNFEEGEQLQEKLKKSLYEMADPHILYILSTISQYTLEKSKKKSLNPLDKVKYEYTSIKETDDFGLRKLENKIVVLSKLAKLLHSSNNLDVIVRKMKASDDPVIQEVFKKLGSYTSTDLNQQILWSKFNQTFSKSYNKLQQLIIDISHEDENDDESPLIIESKYGSVIGGTKAVAGAWDASYSKMISDYIIMTPKGAELNAQKVLDDFLVLRNKKWKLEKGISYVDFYNALGINITDNGLIEVELENNQDLIDVIGTRLQNHINVNEFFENKNDHRTILSINDLIKNHEAIENDSLIKVSGLHGYYNRLQKIEYDLSDKFNSFMAVTAEGESQTEMSLNNTASVITNDINSIPEGTLLTDVIKDNPHLDFLNPETDPFIRSNDFFKKLFELDDKGNLVRTNIPLTFENFSGVSLLYNNGSIGSSNMHLDFESKFMTAVYLSFYNKSEIIRMSGTNTSMHVGIKSEQEFTVSGVLNLTESDPVMYNALKGSLIAEIVRINTLKTYKGPLDAKYKKRGKDFFIFDDILKSKLRTDLKKIKSTSYDEVSRELEKMDQAIIIQQINKYFAEKTETIIKNYSKDLHLSHNIIQEVQSKTSQKLNTQQVQNILIAMYARNKFLHNLNVTTFYLGDPALYDARGDKLHKRNKGLISTGDIFRTDKAFYKFINEKNENGFIKSRGWTNRITENKESYKEHDGTLNVGILKEHLQTSELIDHYKKFIQESSNYKDMDFSAYEGMEEGDGQGFITFDSYRLLMISQGIWTDQQEQQYNLIINKSTTDENGNIIPGNYDQTKFSEFFPVAKLQYFGHLKGNFPLRQQGFHKFNLVPLIPGTIQGTKLEQLHNKMMEQGVDYMTFESGSKLSTIPNESDEKYYSDDRVINDDFRFGLNTIHVKYLKNQLKIHDRYKGLVTLPTQFRSILVGGIFNDQKVPKDYRGTKKQWDALSETRKLAESETYNWYKGYIEALNDIRKYKEDELYRDLGIKSAKDLSKNSTKLVDIIRREFTDRDYAEHQIEYLFDNNQLKSDLSTALTADQLEKLLIALVDKRMTKIKVNGEPLIQMASTLTERTRERYSNPTEAQLEKYSSNELETYYNNGGKVIGMQVKISLQGDFQKLFYLKDMEGKKIAVHDTTKNEKGENIRTLNYNKSLENLNALIKNEKWLKKNKKLITLSASRIPSQGFNSLEFMVISEFLPKNSGSIIIVPSEIVAKAGSDFDVDKLFTLFPNIDVYNGKGELIEYIDINTNVEVLKNKNIALKDKLKITNTKINDLYNSLPNKESNEALIAIRKALHPLYKQRDLLKLNTDPSSNKQLIELEEQIDSLNEDQASYYESIEGEFTDFYTTKELRQEVTDIFKEIKKEEKTRDILNFDIVANKKKINGASIKGLENNLLSKMIERLEMKEVFPELIRSNTVETAKSIADELAEFATDYKKYERVHGTQTLDKNNNKDLSPTQIFDPIFNINKQIENAVGMETLGIGAISAKFAAIFQSIGMYLNTTNGLTQKEYIKLNAEYDTLSKSKQKKVDEYRNYTIKFNHNTTKIDDVTVIDLSKEFNVSNQNISDLLSQLINGWVDVEADSWISWIQGNKEVAPTLTYLIMAGVDFKQAIILASSKYVKKYIALKKAQDGAFYGLNDIETPDNIITSYSDIDALTGVINSIEDGSKTLGVTIADATDAYRVVNDKYEGSIDTNRLEDLIKNKVKKPTSKDKALELRALIEYFTYEQTAKQITSLTTAVRFDTTTNVSLPEIRENQDKFNNLSYDNPALPKNITQMMKDSVIGMFNTNKLQLDLWNNFFSLKTHDWLIATANEFYKKYNYTKDRTLAENQKDFVEEFISYLYQNEYTRINNNVYKGIKLVPKKFDEKVDTKKFNLEGDTFYYDPLSVVGMLDNKNSNIIYYLEKELVRREVKDLEREDVKTSISYKLAEQATKKSEDIDQENKEEYNEKLYDEYLEAEAVIKSGNIIELFEGEHNFATRFELLKQKYPILEKTYALVRDLTPNFKKEKGNLFLSNIHEPGFKSIYKDNLDELKQNANPEIQEFFQMFERFAVLQSGVKSFGKYVNTAVIDQGHVEEYVGKIREDVIKNFDDLSESNIQNFPLLENFANLYYKTDGEKGNAKQFQQFLYLKNRGTIYESDNYFDGTLKAVDDTGLSLSFFDAQHEALHNKKKAGALDILIAKNSDKVIMHPMKTIGDKKTNWFNKVNEYSAHIRQNYPDSVLDEYDATNIVWIYGAAPHQLNNDQLNKNIDNQFKTKYKPQIDKAIESGVIYFIVKEENGIAQITRKYLKEHGYKPHRILTEKGTYYIYSTNKELIANEGLYSTSHQDLKVNQKIDDILNELKEKNRIALPIGEKNYSDLFNYLAANKFRYATEGSRKFAIEKIKNLKDQEILPSTWVDIINDIKIDPVSINEYNEINVIFNALSEISSKELIEYLESTKNKLLIYGSALKNFEKNISLALMQLRKQKFGPVTPTTNLLIHMPSVQQKKKTTESASEVSINTKKWTKDSPKENPNTAYVFTENINSAGGNIVGGGSAVIRNNPNAIGIITKKYYFYGDKGNRTGDRTRPEAIKVRDSYKGNDNWYDQNFQDTDADFELFQKVNLKQFDKLDQFDSKIFPDGFANSLASIPNRFALWLQNQLQTRYGLITEVNSKGTGLISKFVQQTTQLQAEVTPDIYFDTQEDAIDYILKTNTKAGTIVNIREEGVNGKNYEVKIEDEGEFKDEGSITLTTDFTPKKPKDSPGQTSLLDDDIFTC